jgi:hypothetical protein
MLSPHWINSPLFSGDEVLNSFGVRVETKMPLSEGNCFEAENF